MTLQKTLSCAGAAALCLIALYTPAAIAQSAAGTDEIRAQIAALRAEQTRIAEMQRKTEESLRALELKLSMEDGSTNAVPIHAQAAAPAQQRLTVSGDFRVRGQGDYGDQDGRDRDSTQIRGRFGATYAVNDRITIGSRLVTGDADDPNSTDVGLSNFDDDLQVSLDLAYAQLNFGELKVYGGKVPQPFSRTDLVWDGDVNPQGVSGLYRHAMVNGGTFRANGLFFVVDEQAAGPESTMLGGQLGYDSPSLGAWKYDVSAAYYDYRLGSTVGGDSGDFRSNLLNPDGSYLSDFNLGDLLVGATWSGLGERWPVRFVGDYVRNYGAETNADGGFGADLTIGRASQPGDWRVTYGYSKAQTDAVFAAFSHDNTTIGTNYRLHALTFDYVPTPRTQISAIWYHYRRDDALNALDADWLERMRLYFLVNF